MKAYYDISNKIETTLRNRYGASAMSTYYGARYLHGFNTIQSLSLMRMQINELGTEYQGGLECCKFRGKERILLLINVH